MADKLKPEPEDMLLAVKEALSDLEYMKAEIMSVSGHHTTGTRILRDDYWGMLAATRKRLAEVEFLTGRGDWRSTLRRVLEDYSEGLQQGLKVDHWVLGQFVVLRSVLREAPTSVEPSDEPDDYWVKAWSSIRLALENMDAKERMWARSSAADLLMVAQAERWHVPPQIAEAMRIPPQHDINSNDVLTELRAMVYTVGGPTECPAVWPTFRQFWRWRDWWQNPRWAEAAEVGFDYLWRIVRPRFDRETPPASASARAADA
jgi:hypothetical protein